MYGLSTDPGSYRIAEMSIYYIAEVEVGVESCIGASVEFKNPTLFTTQYLILIKADEVKDK